MRRFIGRRRTAHRAFTIFTTSAFMKEAANSLLKVLEEPPERTSLILLTENPHELLPTIRSRAVLYRLGALPAAEIEQLLAERRPELKPQQRALAARLAEGAVGRALTLDLDAYLASRQDALLVLRTALQRAGLLDAVSRDGNLSRRRRRAGEDDQPAARAGQSARRSAADGCGNAGADSQPRSFG